MSAIHAKAGSRYVVTDGTSWATGDSWSGTLHVIEVKRHSQRTVTLLGYDKDRCWQVIEVLRDAYLLEVGAQLVIQER